MRRANRAAAQYDSVGMQMSANGETRCSSAPPARQGSLRLGFWIALKTLRPPTQHQSYFHLRSTPLGLPFLLLSKRQRERSKEGWQRGESSKVKPPLSGHPSHSLMDLKRFVPLRAINANAGSYALGAPTAHAQSSPQVMAAPPIPASLVI